MAPFSPDWAFDFIHYQTFGLYFTNLGEINSFNSLNRIFYDFFTKLSWNISLIDLFQAAIWLWWNTTVTSGNTVTEKIRQRDHAFLTHLAVKQKLCIAPAPGRVINVKARTLSNVQIISKFKIQLGHGPKCPLYTGDPEERPSRAAQCWNRSRLVSPSAWQRNEHVAICPVTGDIKMITILARPGDKCKTSKITLAYPRCV
jgi:hypothetical protein